jgi:Protein of unknown function (DUF5132)
MFEDFGKSNTFFSIAIGTGLVLAAPVMLPLVSGAARPLVKGLIRIGLTVYESGREQAAELSEYAEDLVAEVRAELEQERAARAAQAATPATMASEPAAPAAGAQ